LTGAAAKVDHLTLDPDECSKIFGVPFPDVLGRVAPHLDYDFRTRENLTALLPPSMKFIILDWTTNPWTRASALLDHTIRRADKESKEKFLSWMVGVAAIRTLFKS
jgi:hypothetical protein